MNCANFTFTFFKNTPKSNSTPFELLCVRVQAEVKPGGAAAAELSEAAQTEVMDMCEDQFDLLEKVKKNK